MPRGMISTRLDLDQDMDTKLRKAAQMERRPKKVMAEFLISRVLRLLESDPERAREFQFVRDSK